MKVSIIIVNYNTSQLLKSCIESIKKWTLAIVYEIIVVDNASIDDSVEMLKREHGDVKVIKSADNLGFGKANNLGAKIASGEYLFLLNSDTLLLNNAIKILSDYLDVHKNVAICGGNLFDELNRPTSSFVQILPGLSAEIDYFLFRFLCRLKFGNNLYFNYTAQPLKLDGCISGADLMIRKAVFFEVDGFDPDFFLYYEETELTYRIRKKGYDVMSVPQAEIMHLEGGSETTKENTLIFSFESKIKYYYKTGIKNQISLMHFIYQITALQRIALFFLQNKKSKVAYWKTLLKCENKVYKYSKEIVNSCK